MSKRKRPDASESQSTSREPASWWPLSRDYLEQSRRPLVSLAFIVPLLATYEGGVVYLGPAALRNGADVWLRHLLGRIGLGQYFLLPVLTVGLLLAWHHMTHERWRLPREIVLGMYLESVVLAFGLLGIGYLERNLSQLALAALSSGAESPAEFQPTAPQRGASHPARSASTRSTSAASITKASCTSAPLPKTALPKTALPKAALPAAAISTPGARLVGFCGAGIYEEALFRLLLLPPVAWLLGMFSVVRPWRVGLAIVLTSVVFSAAHYSGAHGEEFQWFSASFRCLAGVFFATLFVYRGFGIAAGTHALYDVLVGLV